jgi:hexokinase
MGKGFAITTNLNLGEMLQTGYARHCSTIGKLPRIRVAAITNDTVATFVSLAYAVKAAPNSRVAMGLIVGTGTNATVPMRPGNLHTEKQSQIRHLATTDNVVINTEWTIRGTDEPLEALKIKTDWDRRLDQSSDAPGFQPFEYMTSGKYLGEIVRLALLDILDAEVDAADIPSALRHKDALSTRFLSEVVARLDEDTVRAQLKKEYPSNDLANDSFWTPTRMRQLCDIARAVQQRSSALIAAASIGLLDCVGDIRLSVNSTAQSSLIEHTSNSQPDVEELVVAYTGSTIAHYPCWLDDCQRWVDELVAAPGINIKKRVVLKEALDGGIIGAGVLAGMENRV